MFKFYDQFSAPMDAHEESYFKALGERLTAARKAHGLTQVELAERLDIPQQTLARYEVGRSRIPIGTLIAMAQVLRFSLDDMLMGRSPAGRSKRGPASKLELQIEAVARLPKSKQRFVSEMLDTILTGEGV